MLFKSLQSYFLKYKWRFIWGMLFVIISNLLAVTQPVVIRYVIDEVSSSANTYQLLDGGKVEAAFQKHLLQMVLIAGFILLALAILRAVFMFLMRQTLIVMSRHIEFDQKNHIFEHLQKMHAGFYKTYFTGDLMNRIAEDVSRVRQFTGPAIMYSINLSVLFVMSLWGMMRVHPALALTVLAPMPFLIAAILIINKKIFRKSTGMQEALSALTTTAQESYSGIRVVKSFAQEDNMIQTFHEDSGKYRKAAIQLASIEAIYFPSMNFFIGISMVFTLLAGGYFVIEGTATPGNIAEFVIYMNLLLFPMSSMGWIASMIQRAAAAQSRINELLQTPEQIENKAIIQAKSIKGSLRFAHVDFIYPHTGIKALQDFNLEIKAGEQVLFIGKTGSGKSSLIQLLLRMYEPTSGNIFLDDQPISAYSLLQLRQAIALVPQEPHLFSDSIENNIGFGVDASTEEELAQAVADSGFAQDVKQLPNALQTKIGERGVMLSGGQKQRLSLARGLLKDAPILIMDESLSAVDVATERRIVSALKSRLKDTTTLVISHRIFFGWQFDKIVVLEDGRIAETGTHEQLMDKKGYYARLYHFQHSHPNLKDS